MILTELIRAYFQLPEKEEVCISCYTLRHQLELVNHEKKELLQTIMNLVKPQIVEASPVNVEPVAPKVTSFSAKRRMMEEADRAQARKLREVEAENKASIDELEKNLGILETNRVETEKLVGDL